MTRLAALRDPLLATAAGATLAFAALTALVAGGLTRGPDRWILDLMPGVASYPLDVLSRLLSYFGNIQFGALAALLLVIWWRSTPRYGWVPLLLFAIVALEYVLKVGIDDPVPPVELRRHVGQTIDWLPRLPTVRLGHVHEFPSGHTARAAFLAIIVGIRYPATRVALAVLVALMVATRIYTGSHFASAAIGGALLGIAAGCLGIYAARRMKI